MATTLKFRRGNKATSDSFTGSQAELFVNTEENRLVVHDGSTTGGFPVTKSSELESANTFLQANDAITLSAAHTYTDSANSWLRANDATTLAAAKSYTDTANSYLGGLIITDTTKTQAAFDKANTAYTAASDSYNYTTSVDVYAQAAFAKANTDSTLAQAAFNSGNTTLTYAQASYAKANADGVLAQAAYDSGNTTLVYAQSSYSKANADGVLAQAAFDAANNAVSGTAADGWARSKANGAFDKANTVASDLVTANTFLQANDATTLQTALSYTDTAISNLINSAPSTLDTLKELADALGSDANFSTSITNSIGLVRNHANGAFDKANTNTSDITTIQAVNTTQNTNITSASTLAQSAFDSGNTTLTYAQAAYDSGNTTLTYAQAGYAKANADGVLAQASFDKANLSITIGNTSTALGGTNVSVDGLSLVGFNASAGATVGQGQIAWNATDRTFDMGLVSGSVLQVGQETLMLIKANNNITNGQTVMFVGVNGNNILGDVCDTSVPGFINDYFIGVATQDIAKNSFGYVTTYGKVRGLNTNGYLAGDILWLDNNNPGALTTTVPAVGTPHIKVAAVTKISGGAGEIMVRPTIKDGLDELYDVGFTSLTTGDVLQYNGSVWVNSGNLTSLTTYSQAGFNHSNTTLTYAQAGYTKANADGVLAQAAFDAGNTTTIYSQTGFAHANASYNKANTSGVVAQAAFDAANTKFSSDGGTINGSVSVLGDITATGNITYSGSVTSVNITGNTGQFWGYSSNGFNALYAGLPAGQSELLPNEVAEFTAANNSYVQINFQNQNGGTSATTDWIATANNGTDTTYFVDLGIAGSGYDNSNPNNSLGTSLFPNDSYLYSQGATSAGQPGGNLVIGAVTSDKYVKVLSGGINNTNVVATFKPSTISLSVPLTFSDSTTISSAPATLGYSQSSFAHANSAYDKANSATTLAQSAFDSGNTTLTYVQASYAKANADGVLAQAAFDAGNTASTLSAAINATQNTNISNASSTATSAQTLAQAAYNSGNTTLTYAQSGYAKANADGVLAQASFDKANTILTITEDSVTSGGFFPIFTDATSGTITTANVSYGLSYNPSQMRLDVGSFLSINGTTATITAANVILGGTNISDKLEASYTQGNTTLTYAQSAYAKANTVASDLATANTFLQGYTDTAISNLVNSAPTTLDTLNELATALGNDANFATTVSTNIAVARNTANAAFDKANTDYTTISTTSGIYGGSAAIPVITLAANGRVSSITNTSITTGTTLTNDTSTSGNFYPLLSTATSGTINVANTSSSKLSFNPAGGTLTIGGSTVIGGSGIYIGGPGQPYYDSTIRGEIYFSGNTTTAQTITSNTSIKVGTFDLLPYSNTIFAQANVAFAQANSAYNTANVGNSFVTSGGYVGGQVTASSLTANTDITVGTIGNIKTMGITCYDTSANQIADSFSTTTYRSAKYEAQITYASSFHVLEIRVLHDGTTVMMNQYGEMFTGSSLGTFDSDISAGNLRLLFTPVNGLTKVKLFRKAMAL